MFTFDTDIIGRAISNWELIKSDETATFTQASGGAAGKHDFSSFRSTGTSNINPTIKWQDVSTVIADSINYAVVNYTAGVSCVLQGITLGSAGYKETAETFFGVGQSFTTPKMNVKSSTGYKSLSFHFDGTSTFSFLYIDTISYYHVTDVAATGLHLFKNKNGLLRGMASIDDDFDANDIVSITVYSGDESLSYRGDIIEWPNLEKSLSDTFCSIVSTSPITLRLNNIDNGIDKTWSEIFTEEELRNCNAVIYAADFGYLYGVVTEYGASGSEAFISIEERDAGVDELFPKGLVTADTFTDTALNIGAVIPLCYGKCLNVPLANIQNYKPATSTTTGTTTDKLVDSAATFTDDDIGRFAYNITQGTYAKITAKDSATQLTVDADIFTNTGDTYGIRCFDYLIGYGTIEGVWDDASNGRGIKRDGVLVSSTEYTVDDGSGSPTDHGYSGYATIRFAKEQVDFSGQPHALTGDIKGLKLNELTADENYITVIRDILSSATRGLGLEINDYSFITTAAARPVATWACSLPIYTQVNARDVINDLLLSARVALRKGADAKWIISEVGTAAPAASLGCNDGFYNNCDVLSTGVVPINEAIKTLSVVYGNEGAQRNGITLACHTGFGQDKQFDIYNTNLLATAKKIASFLYGMSTYGDKTISIMTSVDSVSVGDVRPWGKVNTSVSRAPCQGTM